MRHLRTRRAAAVLTLLAMAAALLSGCASRGGRDIFLEDPNDGQKQQVYLTFFGYKADAINLTAIEAAMGSFMDLREDVDITYECIKGTGYWDAFDKRDAAGVLDDVVMMHHDHLIPMSAQGKLADLSGLAGIENYSDGAREQFTSPGGAVYFLPTQISTYNLYVNYDLLAAHGQAVPENWDQLQQVCDYFVSQGIVPIIANNRNSLPTLAISKALFGAYQKPDVGAAILGFNREPARLAEALAPGVELVAGMLDRGWLDPAEVLVTGQTSDDLELFVQGERPFLISGGWASVRVMAMDPGFSYGVHPYPILDDGSVLSYQVDTCISVNAKSQHVEEAKAFVEHLISPDVMWAYCDSQASYTPLKDDRLPSEKTLVPSTAYLTNGRAVPRSEYRMELPVETALQGCVKVLLEGGTVAGAQAALVQGLEG